MSKYAQTLSRFRGDIRVCRQRLETKIFAKSKPYSKTLQHANQGPRWFSKRKKTEGFKIS